MEFGIGKQSLFILAVDTMTDTTSSDAFILT